VQGMACHEFFQLPLEIAPRSVKPDSCYVDVTGAYQLAHLLATAAFTPCNRIRRRETCLSPAKSR